MPKKQVGRFEVWENKENKTPVDSGNKQSGLSIPEIDPITGYDNSERYFAKDNSTSAEREVIKKGSRASEELKIKELEIKLIRCLENERFEKIALAVDDVTSRIIRNDLGGFSTNFKASLHAHQLRSTFANLNGINFLVRDGWNNYKKGSFADLRDYVKKKKIEDERRKNIYNEDLKEEKRLDFYERYLVDLIRAAKIIGEKELFTLLGIEDVEKENDSRFEQFLRIIIRDRGEGSNSQSGDLVSIEASPDKIVDVLTKSEKGKKIWKKFLEIYEFLEKETADKDWTKDRYEALPNKIISFSNDLREITKGAKYKSPEFGLTSFIINQITPVSLAVSFVKYPGYHEYLSQEMDLVLNKLRHYLGKSN